jgi:hypothetical protein
MPSTRPSHARPTEPRDPAGCTTRALETLVLTEGIPGCDEVEGLRSDADAEEGLRGMWDVDSWGSLGEAVGKYYSDRGSSI